MAMAASTSFPSASATATANPCTPPSRLHHDPFSANPRASHLPLPPLLKATARFPGISISSVPQHRHHRSAHLIVCGASSLSTAQVSSDASAPASDAKKTIKYHFLVANAKFMLDEEEHFQELMRERLRLFSERNREQDFWLAIEPEFLDKFPNISKRLKRPAVALVSTDELWITFMKLRLDRVLKGEIESEKSVAEVLKSANPADLTFEKPEVWTAPYPKYGEGWWTPFLPPQEQ